MQLFFRSLLFKPYTDNTKTGFYTNLQISYMDMITKIISEKKLFWISFAIVGYFCLLYLNAYFAKSDLVFIGWVQELLTIPFILFQFILLIIAILYCIKETFRINRYSFWSFFILLINNLFVICSLIFR